HKTRHAAIERKLKDTGESEEPRISPVLSVDTAADHNSAGTFYTVMPEVGIDSRHASLVASIPWYRNSGSTFSNAGIGDVYATGLLRTSVKRYDLASSLTIGFPTGDHALGLGAGKLTFDAAGTVVVNFGKIRPFVTAGFANSIFNIGYQRPYISDGNPAHFAGGAEFQLTGRLLVGVGGFAVRPQGEQAVVSRAMAAMPGNGNGTGSGNGMGAGNGMGNGRGQSGTPHVPVYAVAPQYSAPASDLQDHGANAWASFRLHQGVNLNFAVARSVPFQLTTVQVGLGFDLAHFLFPAGR
ncbi:MAG: hypothetical protein M1541_02365, partial [Acidobacteria bacterium]|nr:hypothetical protein [Acidobacteriota bacterium]